MRELQVAVLGRGKLGRALALALREAGVPTQLLAGRRPGKLRANVVLLAVPDAQIASVAAALELDSGTVVMHCAGARGLAELAAARAHRGVLHPLLSFASRTHPPQLHGATFTCFGDRRALAAARRIARALGARLLVLPGPPGPAYHAAAALVANGAAALADHGASTLQALGISRRASELALAGLLMSVANNIARVGLPTALTGPVVRGDAATVAGHLQALRELDSELAAAYAALQPLIVNTARKAGLSVTASRAILRLTQR
jgi:predicted short-subunit dehydrogenase-like oxidoreductase (DUF2520 family)